uniref:Uncharacterized protein n=1 Tax=Kalanchoe fedtschenkoi TaxID=63787 RepID=A0A7N0T4J8_KALFE
MAAVLHTTAFLNSNGTTSLCTSNPIRKVLSISRNPQILGAKKLRFRVSLRASGVKDRDFTVLEDDPFSCYSWFSAQVKEGSDMKRSKEDEERQNYYVNTGYAIRSLREKLPELFYREINFDIYRDDIIFKDPRNTFVGIENYKSIFWALRFHGRIFFKALCVEIIRVWQPVDSVIMVRWTIHGIARVPWEGRGRFDGTSEYKLDKNGKIYEHRVDNIAINSPPKFQVLAVEQLIHSISCPSIPKPTCFEASTTSILNYDLILIQLTAIRSLLASSLQKREENT